METSEKKDPPPQTKKKKQNRFLLGFPFFLRTPNTVDGRHPFAPPKKPWF